nr:sugar nucleotide-binding protein [Prevotella sp.]
YMSSRIVYRASKSLKGNVTTPETQPDPNDFYGDSKLQAEKGLHELESSTFKVAILRPPMIYGSNSKGNFLRLGWLATKAPVFPAWHNKRSMLYIDNLAEFVKQIIDRELGGTFFPQNKELTDTVEVVRYFAQKYHKKIWISRVFNPFVWLGSFFLKPIPKMFSDSYYVPEMSVYDFDYQLVSFDDSLKRIEITEANKRMQ